MGRTRNTVNATRLVLFALLACTALAETAAHAQPAPAPGPGPDAHYDELRKRIVEDKRKEIETEVIRRRAEGQTYSSIDVAPSNAAVRTRALDPEIATGPAGRFTAGIKTDLDGTEAGATISPGVLFSSSNALVRGLSLTAASLEESRSRFGAAWSLEIAPKLLTPESLGVPACKSDLGTFDKQLAQLEQNFIRVCEDLIKNMPDPALTPINGATEKETKGRQDKWVSTRMACGYQQPTAENNPGLTQAIEDLRFVINFAIQARFDGDVLRDRQAIQAAYDDLMKFRALDPTDCYSSKEIGKAFLRKSWTTTRHRIGVSGNIDLFPRVWGFNPDESTELPGGEFNEWKVRAEYAQSAGGGEVTVSAGFGQKREKVGDDLEGTVTIAGSIVGFAHAVTLKPLFEDGALNVDNDGELPPYFTVGADLKVELATDPPESQDTFANLSGLEASVFIDFHMNEKLGFRVGLPLEATLATREPDDMAMPPVVERRAVQWTIHPVVATVLTL
jgi:hypothetical protein